MNVFFRRIGAILLALTLCFGSTVPALAAEEVETCNDGIAPASTVIASNISSSEFTDYGTVSVYLSSGNWSADFYIGVLPASGCNYTIVLTAPGGETYTGSALGDGYLHHFRTFGYAPKGTYTFELTRSSGSAASVRAIAQVED